MPIAVGLALADKLRSRPALTACFFGDGAVGEGEFHESLNLAALLADSDLAAIESRVAAEVDEAVRFAEAGPWEPVEDLTRHVYAPVTS